MASSYFVIKGVLPRELHGAPDADKLAFYEIVVELGLKRKDWELARGLNAQGQPLPGVAARTRKDRKSEMTPSGKGDPRAPYLMPGRGLSRTRSLLAGKAHATYAEFFWRYDAWTGDQWGKVLAYHARRGKAYDVVGLSAAGVAWVAQRAAREWRGRARSPFDALAATVQAPASPVSVPLVGRTNLDYADFLTGDEASARKAIAEGRSSGFLSADEWRRHFRQARPAIVAAPGSVAPSVTKGRSNVLLQHVYQRPIAMAKQKLEVAINTLLAGINAGLTPTQIENTLGSQFEQVLAEAYRRGLVILTADAQGRPILRIVR